MELEERLHYEERMEILFLKDNSTGAYEPLLYDCKIIDGEYEGKRILPNSIFHDLIKFVRRLSENIDKNTGQKARGYFEIYQWGIAMCALRCFAELKNKDLLIAIARQSKLYCSV